MTIQTQRTRQHRLDRDETIDDVRVVHASAPRAQDLEGLGNRHRRAIRTVRGQRIEAVHDHQDARADWDVGSGDAIRITRAVPALVVVTDDGTTGNGKSTVERISTPMSRGASSPRTRPPSASRAYSGCARGCRSSRRRGGAPRPRAAQHAAVDDAQLLGHGERYACTRRRCPCVTWSLASTAKANASIVEACALFICSRWRS